MKKKTIAYLAVSLMPFLAVWISFLATAGAFNPIEFFRSAPFITLTCAYYVAFIWIIFHLMEDIKWS